MAPRTQGAAIPLAGELISLLSLGAALTPLGGQSASAGQQKFEESSHAVGVHGNAKQTPFTADSNKTASRDAGVLKAVLRDAVLRATASALPLGKQGWVG